MLLLLYLSLLLLLSLIFSYIKNSMSSFYCFFFDFLSGTVSETGRDRKEKMDRDGLGGATRGRAGSEGGTLPHTILFSPPNPDMTLDIPRT